MRMVVSDLDGTLLKNDKSISKRTMNSLKLLESLSIMFVIATARAKRHVYELLPFNFNNMYTILYNGAEIYHGTELIYSRYIETDMVRSLVGWFIERFPGINISLEISNHLYTNFDINIIKGWIPPYTQVDFNAFSYQPAAKILLDLRGVSDIHVIENRLPKNCKIIITDGGTLGQISHIDVSKINAVSYLALLFGFGLDEVVAFGDDFNDIEMISGCGIGVAMGNAPQEVKEMANIIAKTNNEDGVAIEIECLMKKIKAPRPCGSDSVVHQTFT